ncbi:MSC_0882 family membrane protein [Mesomycoplasma ovipneumoniae]|uniref:MSC_0882 family membrane protein n=1 Tax=Mesomycoplasma ovipneumoniae TaxID=29562 RepID=UPI00296432BD|nr:hypothetical protein [Mesomycoplasma ovipneumoniae]MDW2924117.1 hypothetical protein [Mesomycoplasma ovipneumoniae]
MKKRQNFNNNNYHKRPSFTNSAYREPRYYKNAQNHPDSQEDFDDSDEYFAQKNHYRPEYRSPQNYSNHLMEENYYQAMEQKTLQQEANAFISKEVRKIFGLELIFLPLKALFWLLAFLAILTVSLLWVYEYIPSWNYEQKYLPLLIIPGIIGAIVIFLFVKTMLDYRAIKKSVEYFRSQLRNNSHRLEMPPMIPWLVKKLNQKEVNAIWLAAFSLLGTAILGLVYWITLKYYPEKNIQFSTEFIISMVSTGGFFILMLVYDLTLRRRLSNIEAIFGHVYRKNINIESIRFRRHMLWAIFTVVIFLILRKIAKRKKIIT